MRPSRVGAARPAAANRAAPARAVSRRARVALRAAQKDGSSNEFDIDNAPPPEKISDDELGPREDDVSGTRPAISRADAGGGAAALRRARPVSWRSPAANERVLVRGQGGSRSMRCVCRCCRTAWPTLWRTPRQPLQQPLTAAARAVRWRFCCPSSGTPSAAPSSPTREIRWGCSRTPPPPRCAGVPRPSLPRHWGRVSTVGMPSTQPSHTSTHCARCRSVSGA
jgi:hypothetical protein